ncbi:MAG: hypothetical protein ABL956_11225 [Hyphomonadaceae bacterium]
MIEPLVILHLLGLMLGAAGSFGGVVILALASPSQKAKGGPVRGIGPAMTRMSITGLIMLWPSGIVLMIGTAGTQALNVMFWMKMVFAAMATFATVSAEWVYGRARREPKVARLLLSLSPLAALSYVLAVIFTVLAAR